MRSTRDACYCGSGRRFRRCHGANSGPRVTTLDDAANVVRPVFAEVDDGKYPIHFGGSCTIVMYRGDIWLVSARHVLHARNANPKEIRVPIEVQRGPLRFFKTVSVLYPEDKDSEDRAWLDLVMIRVEQGQRSFAYVDLDNEVLAPLHRATFDDGVRMYGYPLALDSAIDYDGMHVGLESFGVDGAYWGQTSSRFVHAVTFTGFGKVTSLNGMSGGPAFFAPQHGGRYFFAGIIVMGTVESNRMYFIDAHAVLKTLRWHYDEDPNGPRAAS